MLLSTMLSSYVQQIRGLSSGNTDELSALHSARFPRTVACRALTQHQYRHVSCSSFRISPRWERPQQALVAVQYGACRRSHALCASGTNGRGSNGVGDRGANSGSRPDSSENSSAGSSFSGRSDDSGNASTAYIDCEALPEPFCLIESRDSVKNFASMQLTEVDQNITARRNRIFLLMEEVRRLRIQRRLKGEGVSDESAATEPFESAIPGLPPITEAAIAEYWRLYLVMVCFIIIFGALLAPIAQVKLGLGGTTYRDFISSMRLPGQLAAVDPIVASFCGGAVGVLSTLMVVEANNASQQAHRRCCYCKGSGYLTCGACVGKGSDGSCGCALCSGTGKVQCTSCLSTGRALATEHDPRIDPFSS